jgi:hypothetical protein
MPFPSRSSGGTTQRLKCAAVSRHHEQVITFITRQVLDMVSSPPGAPPAVGAPDAGYVQLSDAPGKYVLMH